MMRIGDCPKGKVLEKRRGILKHIVLGRVGGTVGIWSRKTTNFVLKYHRF